MKIGDVVVTPPPQEILVLPRDTGNIVFKANALANWDECERLLTFPVPPKKMVRDQTVEDFENINYKTQIISHNNKRYAYFVIKSLEASKIEWERVKLDDPNTWLLWGQELQDSGLTPGEVKRVSDLVMDANNLNEDKMKKAREAFLAGQVALSNS